MAEVTDSGPAEYRPGGPARPAVHGVLGNIHQHNTAHPPRPLRPLDGRLERQDAMDRKPSHAN